MEKMFYVDIIGIDDGCICHLPASEGVACVRVEMMCKSHYAKLSPERL